jgi:hypothetical protein
MLLSDDIESIFSGFCWSEISHWLRAIQIWWNRSLLQRILFIKDTTTDLRVRLWSQILGLFEKLILAGITPSQFRLNIWCSHRFSAFRWRWLFLFIWWRYLLWRLHLNCAL